MNIHINMHGWNILKLIDKIKIGIGIYFFTRNYSVFILLKKGVISYYLY